MTVSFYFKFTLIEQVARALPCVQMTVSRLRADKMAWSAGDGLKDLTIGGVCWLKESMLSLGEALDCLFGRDSWMAENNPNEFIVFYYLSHSTCLKFSQIIKNEFLIWSIFIKHCFLQSPRWSWWRYWHATPCRWALRSRRWWRPWWLWGSSSWASTSA